MNNQAEISIYILKLENQCYYVGQAFDLEKRISEHKAKNGSRWTTQNPLVEIMDHFSANTSDPRVAASIEDKITIEMMKKYGWKKVRGGYLNHTDEEYIQAIIVKHKIKGVYESICAEATNGAIARLPSNSDQPWSKEELNMAIDHYARGVSIQEIAKKCNRTEKAIRLKIMRSISAKQGPKD